jgi:hypothetical protein
MRRLKGNRQQVTDSFLRFAICLQTKWTETKSICDSRHIANLVNVLPLLFESIWSLHAVMIVFQFTSRDSELKIWQSYTRSPYDRFMDCFIIRSCWLQIARLASLLQFHSQSVPSNRQVTGIMFKAFRERCAAVSQHNFFQLNVGRFSSLKGSTFQCFIRSTWTRYCPQMDFPEEESSHNVFTFPVWKWYVVRTFSRFADFVHKVEGPFVAQRSKGRGTNPIWIYDCRKPFWSHTGQYNIYPRGRTWS